MNKFLENIKMIMELSKIKITSFVGISTFVGYVLYSKSLSTKMILPIIGVFILSCGSSALNHYQERFADALMDRTKGRPIPSGRISANNALIISLLMIFIGLTLIYFFSSTISLFFSVLALIWYNFVYTPLKKKFALAVVPGSLIGALPPMIGYTAAGGSPYDYQIILLSMFFFIWQIPHFWLLLLIFNNDYEKAKYPTLTKIFSNQQLSRITFIWIISLSLCSFLFFGFDDSYNTFSVIAIIISSVWMIFESSKIITKHIEKNIIRKAFIDVNLYVLAIIIIISIDKLFLSEI